MHSGEKEKIGQIIPWTECLDYYVKSYLLPTDWQRAFECFGMEALKEYYRSGRISFSGDFSSVVTERTDGHMTVMVFVPQNGAKKGYAYLLVRNASSDYLLRSIVQQYIYENCDYFIYLDAKNNSYNMFSGLETTPLPPIHCTDYETEIVTYARAFVAEEDQDMVIANMHLANIIKQLETQKVYSFTCGIIEKERGYTRKRLEYRYHDKEKQMILLSRTDITDVYLEEKKKQKALEEALLRAQTDPLTKLWNVQATIDKITEKLARRGKSTYILLFLDLDNFKYINDNLGHTIGDEILRNVADVLRNNTRATRNPDIVGRIGGDEFVIFAQMPLEHETVPKFVSRIVTKINAISADWNNIISCSIGVAVAPQDGEDYSTLVKNADKKLYKAKADGKNRFCLE